MKRILIVVLFLAFGLFAFGQEKKMSAGLGLEWNMDSRHEVAHAAGASLSFYYNMFSYYTAGVIVTTSYNFSDFAAIEPAVLLRRYFYRDTYSKFFAQIDMGAFIIFEDSGVKAMVEAGIRAGDRLNFGSSFYLEPYIRLGYPFDVGIGIITGFCF